MPEGHCSPAVQQSGLGGPLEVPGSPPPTDRAGIWCASLVSRRAAAGHGDPCAMALWRLNGRRYWDMSICATVQVTQKAQPHGGEKWWAVKESWWGWWGRYSPVGHSPSACGQQRLGLRGPGARAAVETPWCPAAVGVQHQCSCPPRLEGSLQLSSVAAVGGYSSSMAPALHV